VTHPQPAPGLFFLTRIGGLTGVLISLGQWVIGDASRYTHAGIVLDDGTVMEAMPSGARIRSLEHGLSHEPIAFSWALDLTDEQAARVVAEARALEGVRYGFSAYLHLALARFGIRWPWLIRRLERNGRLYCSQLVDEVYRRAGVHLFTDGRAPFDVTPGDLANLLIERYWRQHLTTDGPA
jgi:cell wall-associated NlpC family hydrolase